MGKKQNLIMIKILTVITFLAMIIVNALANILPINGVNTGQVSDSYQNLFAPTGLTFSIWGVIYLLLAAYTLYHLGFFQTDKNNIKSELLYKTGIIFSISSLANTAWIFSWHYHIIPLSMLLMVVILACLIYIIQIINRENLSLQDKIFIKLPFSVYFGWITVATIANATTLLVSWDWNGFGISEPVWAILIITVGMLIGAVTTVKNRDIAYGIVLIWAYVGILIKHSSTNGFSWQYPEVITTVIICIILLVVALMYILLAGRRLPDKKQ